MAEWELAQTQPSDELAQLHFFSMKKKQPEGEIEFQIVVREYIARDDNRSMLFFAEANRQTNQNTAPYTPTGWGSTLLKALSECVKAIHRFPYEGPLPDGK
jgi:hypothetical protein